MTLRVSWRGRVFTSYLIEWCPELIHFAYVSAYRYTDIFFPPNIALYRTVTEPASLVRCTASQTLKYWGLLQGRSSFTRQPNKEMGEQVSDLPPWRWGAGDIYGVKKQGGLGCGRRSLEVGKRWGYQCSMQVYLGYMLLHGRHSQKWKPLMWSDSGVFGLLTSEGHLLTCPLLRLVVPTSLSQPALDKSWIQVTKKQCKLLLP